FPHLPPPRPPSRAVRDTFLIPRQLTRLLNHATPSLKIDRHSAAEDVGPAAAARRRRFAVVDGEVPLQLGVGVQVPIQPEDDVVQSRAIHALVLKIEITIADADLPGAQAGLSAPDVEVAARNDSIEDGILAVVGAGFAREEIEHFQVGALVEERAELLAV